MATDGETDLDIDRLGEKFPKIGALAAVYSQSCAAALGQNGHDSGVEMIVDAAPRLFRTRLVFTPLGVASFASMDRLRAIEFAADAVALAVMGSCMKWAMSRRLQVGDRADWLMID